jgi:ferrous iron transport protein B
MSKKVKAVLIGNPNSGKSTIFNAITHKNQRVGNWPGVTVEKKLGHRIIGGYQYEIIDLPGIYSLNHLNEAANDEKISSNYLLNEEYDLIINVIDASNIERNLYLTVQLLELKKPMIMVLNMEDLSRQKNFAIDTQRLAQICGCEVLLTNAKRKKSLNNLMFALEKYEMMPDPQTFVAPYPPVLNALIEELEHELGINRISAIEHLMTTPGKKLRAKVQMLEESLHEDLDMLVAGARYEAVNEITDECLNKNELTKEITTSLDKLFLNKYLSFPIFLIVMYLMFTFAFFIGGALQDPVELFASAFLIELPKEYISSAVIQAIIDGVGGGIVTVVTFIPVIGALYLYLAFLEESGYIARAAYVMDDLLQKIGLPGKAFIPLIVGFGCNVPAIGAARTIQNTNDRITTIMMSPFMSCGARLSVYALFCAAFFKENGHNVIFSLYLLGIAVALFTGFIVKKLFITKSQSYMMIELPRYQLPNPTAIMKTAIRRVNSFVFGAGKTIVIVFLLITILNNLVLKGSNDTVIERFAKLATKAFAPIGISEDNWPAAASLITGILAKEVVVGTLSAFYNLEDTTAHGFKNTLLAAKAALLEGLAGIINTSQLDAFYVEENISLSKALKSKFTNDFSVYAYLLFVLLYFPCVSVFAAIGNEIGLKWAFISAIWSTLIAYSVAVLFYQGYLFWLAHQPVHWFALEFAIIAPIVFIATLFACRHALVRN